MGGSKNIIELLNLINSQVKTGLLSFLESSYSNTGKELDEFLGAYTDKVLSFKNIRGLSKIVKKRNESKSKKSKSGGSKKIFLKGGGEPTENQKKLILLYKQIVDYCPSELDIYYILLQEAGGEKKIDVSFEKIGLPLLKHSHTNYKAIREVFISSDSSKSLSDELKGLYNMNGDNSLNLMQNNHQFMAASFLNRTSAMRGLVIYHGLGSGKTATAVTATLGHSLNKKTIVLLPASIEKNFYADLTKFSNISQYTKCRWYIYGVNTRKADGKSSKTNTKLFGKYLKEMGVGMSEKQINEICKYTITNDDIINYSKDILKGLDFIKDLNIIHCDLKPENIIIEKKRAIIIDYGSSIFYNKKINNTYIQSRFYRAPECLFDIKQFISYEIDIWSFGCILYEMYKKKPLFPGKTEDNMTFHIKSILGKPNKNYIDNLFNNNIKGKQYFSSNLSETTYNSKKYLLETEDNFELLIFNLIKKCLKYYPLERYTPKQSLDYLSKNIYI